MPLRPSDLTCIPAGEEEDGAHGEVSRKEDPVSTHSAPTNDPPRDPYACYASPVGPRILEGANTIFEDFPVWKYILYGVIFAIEVAAVFYIGVSLVK